jgi:hypothetical protein
MRRAGWNSLNHFSLIYKLRRRDVRPQDTEDLLVGTYHFTVTS